MEKRTQTQLALAFRMFLDDQMLIKQLGKKVAAKPARKFG